MGNGYWEGDHWIHCEKQSLMRVDLWVFGGRSHCLIKILKKTPVNSTQLKITSNTSVGEQLGLLLLVVRENTHHGTWIVSVRGYCKDLVTYRICTYLRCFWCGLMELEVCLGLDAMFLLETRIIQYLNKTVIGRGDQSGATTVIGREASVTPVGWERMMIGILWLGRYWGFICVQT